MSRKKNRTGGRHRLTAIWKDKVDREGLARALLLLAMHLDEKERMAHIKQQNPPGETDGQRGGGHDEQE